MHSMHGGDKAEDTATEAGTLCAPETPDHIVSCCILGHRGYYQKGYRILALVKLCGNRRQESKS